MKVYILFWRQWDNSEILDVFATRESAEEHLKSIAPQRRRNIDIEEREVFGGSVAT